MQNTSRMTITGPPRSISLLSWLHILFGGTFQQIGWLFFSFGMIFVWFFIPYADLTAWYEFSAELETTPGTVFKSEDANISVNEVPYFALHYRFTHQGQPHEGISYAPKSMRNLTKVTVEFPIDWPQRSRIVGTDTSAMGVVGIFVAIFPTIGGIFILISFRRNRKGLRLIVHGQQTVGTFKSKESTNTTINDQRVYKMIYEYEVKHGQYEVSAKTHLPETLEENPQQPIFYDEFDPEYSTLVSHLPGKPYIDENGAIRTTGSVSKMMVILLPLITILGHGGYLIYLLTR